MPRTILVTGPCGSGKSTLLSVGQRTIGQHLGRTATIDTDVLQMMVDPAWELPEDEWGLELSGWQCWLLAQSFLQRGFETVIIGSSGFHTPAEGLNDMIGLLLTAGDVHHVTLDASIEEIQRRVVERGSDMTAASVAEHVKWMRRRQRAWSCRVDNTSLTPEETIAEIAVRVLRGEGRLMVRCQQSDPHVRRRSGVLDACIDAPALPFTRVVDPASDLRLERLVEPSRDAVIDINVLLPQLKPSWGAIGLTELQAVLESPTRAYVARVDGRIVGLTLMVPHRHFGGLRHHVEDVVVDETHRRRGIARRLLEFAIADAPGDVASFDLRSHRARSAALQLYLGLGFVASDTTVFRKLAGSR